MTHLEQQLKELRESLTEMAVLVKKQLKKSVCALIDKDEDLATEVLVNEKRVNALELNIDRDCGHIFTLLTPVAQDMRFVFATLKINADLERIGDYAEGIAKLVLLGKKSFDEELVKTLRVKEMHDTCMEMMEDVIQAYAEDNTKVARSVFAKDLQLNEINQNASGIIEDYLRNSTDRIQQGLLLVSIIRKLERVGDHITNIAEDVIYYKEAEILKHIKKNAPNN